MESGLLSKGILHSQQDEKEEDRMTKQFKRSEAKNSMTKVSRHLEEASLCGKSVLEVNRAHRWRRYYRIL